MIQGNENQSAWDQYYAAAVIAVSAKASEGKGSPRRLAEYIAGDSQSRGTAGRSNDGRAPKTI
ncbi:hypothetical protein UMZ34_16735 [Halopseudomonas pachastrellae]|nr:hypothetical protein UMZ34_16735 [Halopseudomonas pachastrellae]